MTDKNLDSIFEEFKQKVTDFSEDKSKRTNLYDFEKEFAEIVQKYENEIFQASLGEIPKSKNKKKQ